MAPSGGTRTTGPGLGDKMDDKDSIKRFEDGDSGCHCMPLPFCSGKYNWVLQQSLSQPSEALRVTTKETRDMGDLQQDTRQDPLAGCQRQLRLEAWLRMEQRTTTGGQDGTQECGVGRQQNIKQSTPGSKC